MFSKSIVQNFQKAIVLRSLTLSIYWLVINKVLANENKDFAKWMMQKVTVPQPRCR